MVWRIYSNHRESRLVGTRGQWNRRRLKHKNGWLPCRRKVEYGKCRSQTIDTSSQFYRKLSSKIVLIGVTKWNARQSVKPSRVIVVTSGSGQWKTRSKHYTTGKTGIQWDHAQTETQPGQVELKQREQREQRGLVDWNKTRSVANGFNHSTYWKVWETMRLMRLSLS